MRTSVVAGRSRTVGNKVDWVDAVCVNPDIIAVWLASLDAEARDAVTVIVTTNACGKFTVFIIVVVPLHEAQHPHGFLWVGVVHRINQAKRYQSTIRSPHFQVVEVVPQLFGPLYWRCVKPWVLDVAETPFSQCLTHLLVFFKLVYNFAVMFVWHQCFLGCLFARIRLILSGWTAEQMRALLEGFESEQTLQQA